MALPKNSTFALYTAEAVPLPPIKDRICVTCLDPMHVHYAWKSSEAVIHYFCICHCGSRSKGKMLHYRINSRGGLVR